MKPLTPFLGLTVLIAGVPAFAQAANPQGDEVLLTRKRANEDTGSKSTAAKGVTWKFGFEKGRTTKFKQKSTLAGNLANGLGFIVEIKIISTETVKAVSKTGDGTIEIRNEVGEATINDKPLRDPFTALGAGMVRSANGLLAVKMPTYNGMPNEGEALAKVAPIMLAAPVPPSPVVPGDEWKTEIDNPFLPGQKVVVTSHFEERGKFGTMIVNRVRINALVSVRENDEENADALQINGFYEFEPVKRRIVKSDITLENAEVIIEGQKTRITSQALSEMIGIPDQITPRSKPVKKRVKSRR